jgi:hypothetical protein
MNDYGAEPKGGAIKEFIEKIILVGNEAESVIETVNVLVGAKSEQPRLVILEVHEAL